MRKGLIGLLAIIAFAFVGYKIYESVNDGPETYYTRVMAAGKRLTAPDAKGRPQAYYTYAVTSYDANGTAKAFVVDAKAPDKIAKATYLAVRYSADKGATTWEIVSAADIPKKALERLP